jgi:hypothetical protein
MDPRALWQAGGATALFITGFGAAGYATRRDLAPLASRGFLALAERRVDTMVVEVGHGGRWARRCSRARRQCGSPRCGIRQALAEDSAPIFPEPP